MKKILTSIITLLMLTTCLGFNVAAEENEPPESEIAELQTENQEEETEESAQLLSENVAATVPNNEQSVGRKPIDASFRFVFDEINITINSSFFNLEGTEVIKEIVMDDVFDYYYQHSDTVDFDEYCEAVKNGKV
ncbi:MAG: hypothetical protein SPK79_10390, partial [Erysipelotrichaceae bacterium]|nr:hypothetical protein [Erysipelotrichaceae bacterium]